MADTSWFDCSNAADAVNQQANRIFHDHYETQDRVAAFKAKMAERQAEKDAAQ